MLGTAERIASPGVKEPSGIAFHPPNGHLFVVGDEGALSELDAEGKVLNTTKIEAQIEDVTVHTPTGLLVFISESRSELILYDPATRQERKRWPLDLDAMLGTSVTDRNQGFEGVVFRPEAGRPGGGVFYLTHQRAPAMVIALQLDPAVPGAAAGRGVGLVAMVAVLRGPDRHHLGGAARPPRWSWPTPRTACWSSVRTTARSSWRCPSRAGSRKV